jgi:lysozyme
MQLSSDGIDFIIELEGVRSQMYNDNAGNCTIGIGHLIHPGRCVAPLTSGGSRSLTGGEAESLRAESPFINGLVQQEVRRLFDADKQVFEDVVNDRVTVQLTQPQFDALISFSFNVGAGHFAASSLVRALNEGSYQNVPTEIRRWIYSTQGGVQTVNPGLQRRREREAELFLSGRYR